MSTTLLFILCALAGMLPEQIDYPRTMYVGYQRAPLYESPDYLSTIIGELGRGDSVHVVGMEKKFFRIEHAGRTGYVLGSNLTLAAPKRKPAAATVTTAGSPSPKRPKEPALQSDTATARCSAMTRSGARCTRKADSLGLCWQHRKK